MVVHRIQVLVERKQPAELVEHQPVTHCQVMQELSTEAEMLAMIPAAVVVVITAAVVVEIMAAAVVDRVLLIRELL
jgi:hypothetical protein